MTRFALAALALVATLGCGSESDRTPMAAPSAGNAGTAHASGSGGRNTAGTAAGGTAPAGSGGSGAAGAAANACGNGLIDAGEDCDGASLPSCEELGYGPGVVLCADGCRLDSRDCERVERCADGRDNDDDGRADCEDSQCADQCASACSEPEPLIELQATPGSNAQRTSSLALSCSPRTPGAAVVYSLTATRAGMLDVSLETDGLFDIAIRSSCAAIASERACGLGSASAAVEENETVFVVVQGLEAGDARDYVVRAVTREVGVCGDGVRDDSESCDDGNVTGRDGCDARCELEATELEPNDRPSHANSYMAPFYGEIQPANDVDMVDVVVGQAGTTLVASTQNFGDGACAGERMDTLIELHSASGRKLASDDDGGDGLCSRLVVSGLAAGRYRVLVRAVPQALPATFPYRLAISTDTCGNGATGPSELCDDGNTVSGDGCSSSCARE